MKLKLNKKGYLVFYLTMLIIGFILAIIYTKSNKVKMNINIEDSIEKNAMSFYTNTDKYNALMEVKANNLSNVDNETGIFCIPKEVDDYVIACNDVRYSINHLLEKLQRQTQTQKDPPETNLTKEEYIFVKDTLFDDDYMLFFDEKDKQQKPHIENWDIKILNGDKKVERIENFKIILSKINYDDSIKKEIENGDLKYRLKPLSCFGNIANKDTLKGIKSFISNKFMRNIFDSITMKSLREMEFADSEREQLLMKIDRCVDIYTGEPLKNDFIFLNFQKTDRYQSDIQEYLVYIKNKGSSKEKKLLSMFCFEICVDIICHIEYFLKLNGLIIPDILLDHITNKIIVDPIINYENGISLVDKTTSDKYKNNECMKTYQETPESKNYMSIYKNKRDDFMYKISLRFFNFFEKLFRKNYSENIKIITN